MLRCKLAFTIRFLYITIMKNKDYKYFKLEEFKCKCGNCNGGEMNHTLIALIDRAREIAGIPFKINSGFRCNESNTASGGVNNSSHLKGLAVDIKVTDSRSRYLTIRALSLVGLSRFGIGEDFIHVDLDTSKSQKVTWLY